MVQGGELRPAVALAVQQRGGQRVAAVADGVLDKAQAAGPQRGLRALLPRPVAGQDRHERVAAVAEHELAEEGVGVALQAEDRVQATLAVGVQQLEGVVAAVVDDDIAGGKGGEVGQGGAPLVAMGVQVEVDREAGAQLVKGS